jgi:hypothetical protein
MSELQDGHLGFNSWGGGKDISFCHYVQTSSGAQPAFYLMGTERSFPSVKWPGQEADHSPPSSAKVKNAWSYTSTPPYVLMAWYFVKHRENFPFSTFTSIASRESLRISHSLGLHVYLVCQL